MEYPKQKLLYKINIYWEKSCCYLISISKCIKANIRYFMNKKNRKEKSLLQKFSSKWIFIKVETEKFIYFFLSIFKSEKLLKKIDVNYKHFSKLIKISQKSCWQKSEEFSTHTHSHTPTFINSFIAASN